MGRHVKIGDLVIPPETLQLISPESSGIVVFSGALLLGEPSEWLQKLQQLEGAMVRLEWRDGLRGRSDIVRVRRVCIERKPVDEAAIIRYSCETQIVG